MTSSINPNNIDGAYPVAGQDNNSQGFRDNFTNTKTNFEYAATEITDLQNKAVLKSALTGTVLNNDMGGSILSNAQIQDFSATVVNLGTTSGSVTINYAGGHYQTVSSSGSLSLSFSNFPTAGVEGFVSVAVTITNTAHTLTLPVAVSIGNAGLLGINSTTNVITFAQTGTYVFDFTTVNGGTTVTVEQSNIQFQPLNSTTEDLAPSAAVSLATSASFFTTAAAETATLAAGVTGQVKVLAAANVTAGNMVVTVTNAGWQASGTGTITFDTRGDACTLQYFNSKWFCIGNNGCTFG
jgi:hypothetical protein